LRREAQKWIVRVVRFIWQNIQTLEQRREAPPS
jgi:hypothetical protein